MGSIKQVPWQANLPETRFFLYLFYLHTKLTPEPGEKFHELQRAQPPPLAYQFQLVV